MSKFATPSAIARSVAAALWPDVQVQRKLCSGAYAFTCAGHGGIVAIVEQLPDVDAAALTAARAAGLTALVADVQHGRRHRRYCTAAGYRATELLAMAASYPNRVKVYEVWIGEEDCDWSTLALASDAVRDGCYRSGYSIELTREFVRDTAVRWCSKFVAALEEVTA